MQYKYKLLRDTVRVIHRDSIPYEVRIETIKEVPRKRTWLDTLSYCAFGILLAYGGIKLSKHLKPPS